MEGADAILKKREIKYILHKLIHQIKKDSYNTPIYIHFGINPFFWE